jgi:D-alanine-D-alanine ligase
MKKKVRVGLIFGGRSGEHEVSLMSAQGVMGAIDKDRYEVVPIGITKEGRWLASGDPMKALSSGESAESYHAALLAEPSQQGLMRLEEQEQNLTAVRVSELDVVFPILHGPYGEDGTVQGLLELAGIPYVGAGVTASAVGMDKALFKDIMRAHGLPIAPYLVIKRKRFEAEPDQVVAQIETEIGYVVEVAVDAREIEVSVLGNDQPIASVPGEIVPCNEFYDYAAKYIDAESELLIPAPIPPETAEAIRRTAVQAYLAIDCAGMARADFLLDRTTGEVYLNEVNTLPGFTPRIDRPAHPTGPGAARRQGAVGYVVRTSSQGPVLSSANRRFNRAHQPGRARGGRKEALAAPQKAQALAQL